MQIAELQRIKQWQVSHRRTHPVEYQAWDLALTMWVAGWVGWLPAFTFEVLWIAPLCAAAMSAPQLYVAWRRRLHRQGRLRCDWLCAADALLPRRPHVRR